MKNIFFIIISLLFFYAETTMAYHDKAWNKVQTNRALNASGCTRAASSTTIEYNNVRALIHTGGDMWWDLVGLPKYEVPKGSGKTALFAGAIWMGGTDINDQLRMAAVKFRTSGVDYWPGPLIISGMDRATVTPEVCLEYDKHFVITRQEVSEFRSYIDAFLAGDNQTIENDFSEYQIPDIILDWPGNGNSTQGYDFYLAPYVDADANGNYNPETGGDYPFFDLDGEVKCGTSRALRKPRLYGDQTMWWVYNDKGNVHGETNGEAIGMEVRAQYFAFSTSDELNNMTFGNYALINRSTYTLFNTYFGVWTDADLGKADDDYVGCDVTRGLGYLYNGYDVDGTGNGTEYGENPPAIGVDFFEGPYMDPLVSPSGDTIDRPSPYLFDLAGNQTTEIDPNMPDDITEELMPYGLFNGGINGLNFGDSIGGNERWGMRRFLYFNNDQTQQGDPEVASDYYNYLDGRWKDNRKLIFGGNGYASSGGTPAHFMFPGVTDPVNWGTEGVDPEYTEAGGWTEESENNPPADRRFVQSAGPFTLLPGAVNDITVGMVWARATTGSAFESVKKVQEADDKAQKLFDNCFVMIDGPDSPELEITELDGELIFQIFNDKGLSNNYKDSPEDYYANDPFIVVPQNLVQAINDDASLTDPEKAAKIKELESYRFEGYQVFQVKDNSVTTADLNNSEYSRLVFQCDVKNDITEIINYTAEPITGKLQPSLMVSGSNEGIQHTFKLTEDAFAETDKAFVNHKKYYFIAVAYAYNQFMLFDPEDSESLTGQKVPYLRGRKSAKGSIKTFLGIPHRNMIQSGGIVLNSSYGDGIPVTMVEGMGNGNNVLNLTQKTIDKIMSGKPWYSREREYEAGSSPISIKVVDPLNVKNEDYILRFDSLEYSNLKTLKRNGYIDYATWYVYPESEDSIMIDTTITFMINDTLAVEMDTILYSPTVVPLQDVVFQYNTELSYFTNGDTLRVFEPLIDALRFYPDNAVFSEKSITYYNEQVISELGIALFIQQVKVPGPGPYSDNLDYDSYQNGYLTSSVTFSDPSKFWLTGVGDSDGENIYNWIRTGILDSPEDPTIWNSAPIVGPNFIDPENYWTNIANGIFSIYRVVMYDHYEGTFALQHQVAINESSIHTTTQEGLFDEYKRTSSIDFVITKDTTKWTRCPVVEMCENDVIYDYDANQVAQALSDQNWNPGPSEGGIQKFLLRQSPSVYRNGKPIPTNKVDSVWVHNEYFRADTGMGWFPGYAIDIETGERLNIFFGEDTRWGAFNGRDMIWNPHHRTGTALYEQTGGSAGEPVFGAKHNIYVSGHSARDTTGRELLSSSTQYISVGYDYGARNYAALKMATTGGISNSKAKALLKAVYGNVIYAARPLLRPQFSIYDQENDPYGFIQSDVEIKIRMANPYRGLGNGANQSTLLTPDSIALNNNAPMFKFSTQGMGATYNNDDVAESALDFINIVPNPYYAYNEYELKQTQKLVKFTNLPEECTITIYNIGGQQVRKFDKSSPLSYLDWDLKNEYGIEIASGVYIIHIKVPGVGEKILKWFGALRPIDLNNI